MVSIAIVFDTHQTSKDMESEKVPFENSIFDFCHKTHIHIHPSIPGGCH